MSLGYVLVQPQKLKRAAALDADAVLVSDVISLAARIAADADQGGQILQALTEGVQATATRLQERLAGGLENSGQRLKAWLKPAIDLVGGLMGTPPGDADPTEGLKLVEQLLRKLSETAARLTLDQLRAQVALLLDVLQNDFGLTSDFIREQVWALLEDVAARLEAVPPGSDPAARDNCLASASVLRRVKRRLHDEFVFPQLNADAIARDLFALLQESGIPGLAGKAACMTSRMATAVEAATPLTRLVHFAAGGNPGRSPKTAPLRPGREPKRGPAAAPPTPTLPDEEKVVQEEDREEPPAASPPPPLPKPTYCWYASWLLGSKNRFWSNFFASWPLPWMPNPYDDVWIDPARKRVLRGNGNPFISRPTILTDPETNEPYDQEILDWKKIPVIEATSGPRYSFKKALPDTMEKWAFHTAWAADALKTVAHLSSIEEGDWASNVFHALVYGTHLLCKGAAKSPLNWWLPIKVDREPPLALWWLLRAPWVAFGASFQGIHKKAASVPTFKLWLTLLLATGGEAYLVDSFADGLRDLLLSFVTLLNYDGPARHESFPDDLPDHRPLNRKEIGGIANSITSVFISQLMARLVDRKDYCHPGKNAARLWGLWCVLGGIGFGILGGFTGAVVAECIAWAEDWPALGWQLLKSMAMGVLLFWPSLYLAGEGKTDGGKYNPRGAAFPGYPSASTSPYTLPYAAGVSYLVGQANQGIWSHNDQTRLSQVYAFDFGMDKGDEVLASRPGTVDLFDDQVPDDVTGGAWNFIRIRHDLDDNGQPLQAPLAGHDVADGGAPTVTFAEYGHGMFNSVTDVFNRRGIARANIIGSPVVRGQPIMRANCTGVSFYNHLHMQVLPEVLPRGNPRVAGSPLSGANPGSDHTIPFVFRDVKGRLELNRFTSGTDGVPSALNYYTSSTERQGP